MVFVDIVAEISGSGKDSSAIVPEVFVFETGFSEMKNGLNTLC